ncbi:MAG: diguanylate cyclase, partial [Erysipelotrichaceae bacterium]
EIIVSIVSIIAIENYKVVPQIINQLTQMLYFLMSPIITLLFTQYIISVGWEEDPKIQKYSKLALIPYLLYVPFVLTNPLTRLIYDITKVNGFIYGKGFILTYLIHIIYIAIMFILAIASRKRLSNDSSQVLLSFPIVAMSMIIIESVFPNIILLGTAAAISSLIVCLYILNKQHIDLKESEQRFKDLFTLKGDALFVIDKEYGNILEVNDAACIGYGYTRDEMLLLKNTDMSFEPEKTLNATSDFDTVEMKRIPIRYHRKKDGTVFPVEIVATLLKWKSRDAILVVAKDITEQKNTEEKLVYLGYHDQLTGLYNRRFFEEELVRLDTKRNLPITIAMGDVNGLKLVNDTFGHQSGDLLLKNVALVLQKVCREDDIIARLGGDEFAIILPKTTEEHAEKIIARILEYSNNEQVEGLSLSISFGYHTKNVDQEDMKTVMNEAEEKMYRHKLNESSSIRNKSIPIIMKTLFEKNAREMEHSERVSDLCVKIATEMGFDKNAINRIRTVGLMHDIGKIGIEEAILNSDKILESEDIAKIRKHSEIGYRILKTSIDFTDIAEDVYSHHERWDGKGYPRGIAEENISIFARIISVADSYDAMVSNHPSRTYRKSMNDEEAINEIRRNSGTQFDPKVAQFFVEKVMHLKW